MHTGLHVRQESNFGRPALLVYKEVIPIFELSAGMLSQNKEVSR